MTAAEFRTALASFEWTQRRFAEFCGLDERSVRRWACEERAVPPWVPVMFRLMRASWPRLGTAGD